MKIAMVASEAAPFVKTGGLGDVLQALPQALSEIKNNEVSVFIPFYDRIKYSGKYDVEFLGYFDVPLAWRREYVGLLRLKSRRKKLRIYFIDNEHYFCRGCVYGCADDGERYAYFAKAALASMAFIGLQPDIIHCHDWQAGLVPVYLKTLFAGNPFFSGMKSVMTIHNLQFQGKWDIDTIKADSGLPDYVFTPDKLEVRKDASMLKGGLVYADKITTVSNTYAREIQTPYYGEGLDGLLSARWQSLWGIVNGIDYDVWNPATDPQVYKNYSVDNFRELKKINKVELQKECGLPQDDKQFVIGIISRLTDQKGLDLVDRIMNDICCDGVQFIVLGTGDSRYEDMFRYYQGIHPAKVSANIYYSDERSHKMYAGCDVMLVPSRFEPCGLTQLMALRYGTVPIVRETGGLKDTVEPYNEYESKGTGFSFSNYNAHEMLNTIRYAEKIYYDKKREWNKIIDRAMATDYSWSVSALKYQEMYDWLIDNN